MHYLIQSTVATLRNAALTDGGNPQWLDIGGGKYIGWYTNGQAVFQEIQFGSPLQRWFEVQATDVAVLTDMGFPGASLMRDELRTNGTMRGYMKSSGRALVRNSSNVPVGVLPGHVICGTDPTSSFLAGDDPDTAQTLPDLE